ncbi:MAG: hypothetical protein J6X66_02310, partial [Lachnospiraceae bacterium]|nr:hypothetical protein [Lachnospiraceae bacterium]
MKKLKERFRRIGTICLTAVMLVTQTPVTAFAAEEEVSVEKSISDNAVDNTGDVITEAEGEALTEASKEEDVKTEEFFDIADDDMPAFEDSQTVEGVKITVTAVEGLFPEGAVLSVKKVTNEQEKQAEDAVEAERPDDQNVAASYTYDIKVLDQGGNEIQPADESKVKLSFAMEEVADANLTTGIYHIRETDSASKDAAGGTLAESEL